jgi:hypothetical protein
LVKPARPTAPLTAFWSNDSSLWWWPCISPLLAATPKKKQKSRRAVKERLGGFYSVLFNAIRKKAPPGLSQEFQYDSYLLPVMSTQ